MTITGIAAAQAVAYPFLEAHFPAFPRPTITENTAAPMEARYFTTDSGIIVPLYSDAWNEGRPEIIVHECGHWLAIKSGRAYPDLVAALGIAYDGAEPGEVWAEQFARAYVDGYDGNNYPELAAIPCDAARVRAFAQSLTPNDPPPAPPPGPRLMFDSTTPADIPDGSALVAGYVDGAQSRWPDAAWASFPGRLLVRISVLGNDADVLDVEAGAATPEVAPEWAKRQRARGAVPCVYVNLSNVDAVRTAFDAAGEPQPDYWLAHYGAPPVVPDGYVALQYANEPLTGGHYDASVVIDAWPRGGDMTPDEVIAAIEAKYDLANTIAALKKNDERFAEVVREGAAALAKIDAP